jgi:uncharacterized protein (DUF1499 family)
MTVTVKDFSLRRRTQMLIIKWLVIVVPLLAVVAVAAGQLGFLQGTAPTDLGVRDGKLKPPSMTPNSVTSQAALYPEHPQRNYASVAPLPSKGDGPATLARIKDIVEGMEGAKVIKSEPGYLYAQFTSRLMKFVDDVEFWFDPAADVIQVRSASRVGRGDMGVNRRRIEAVRAALEARTP